MIKKVLTQEEIQQVTKLREEFNSLTISAGEIEMQIINLQLQKDKIKDNFIKLQTQESKVINELENKYGKGTISLETGEFISNS
ncbi:hypothetical protein N9P60_00155 [bacterium]|jgi:hypothetical protein|nr:hypothetical protein [bacterium]MDB4319839.1 hypothetical protein [bacterium]MDB9992683.1 hypothetical protein [bacterium]|tara:strand:- start:954 stop:1205 length:252 start_codon:yes stop_codon:yes gene_type:complete